MDTVIVLGKFEVRSFTRSRDNSIWTFGWGANPKSWRRGGRRGSGMVPFERANVSSYRLPTVTFPLYVRVSEILPLLCYVNYAACANRKVHKFYADYSTKPVSK